MYKFQIKHWFSFLLNILFFSFFFIATNNSCPYPYQRCICAGTLPNCPCQYITSTQGFNFTPAYLSHLVLDGSYGCRPCPPRCRKCSSLQSCTECFDQYQLRNNMLCDPCPINCKKCRSGICIQCIDQYYIDYQKKCQKCPLQGTKTCTIDSLRSCKSNYWLDNNGAQCVNCEPNCKLCSSITKCIKCSEGYFQSQFKCIPCRIQCKSCTSNISCLQCRQTGYYYSTSLASCLPCPESNCLSCNSNGTCLLCDYFKSYYLDKTSNKCNLMSNSLGGVQNCRNITSTNQADYLCETCQDNYYSLTEFTNASKQKCFYGCSILCNKCTGPHYGLCEQCVDSTSFQLINKNCVPKYNLNQGSSFQHFHTAFNNNSFFEASQLIKPDSCWHQYAKGGTNTIRMRFSALKSYKIKIKWKVYQYKFDTQAANFSNQQLGRNYQVVLTNQIIARKNQTLGYSFTSQVCQQRKSFSTLCPDGFIRQCIDKNQAVFENMIAYGQNLIQIKSENSFIAISQLLLIGYRCGGIYGQGCAQCSDINSCTKCQNPVYYLIGQKCLSECPNSHYTYEQEKKCHQLCPLNSYSDDSLHVCYSCKSPCETCLSQSYCLTCKQGFFYNDLNEKCQQQCPAMYYKDNYRRICEKCTRPCLECTDSNTCINCRYGYLNATRTVGGVQLGMCVLQCSEGHYTSLLTLKCQLCTQPCSTCHIFSYSCTSCAVLYYLLASQCLPQCPAGYFENLSLKQCQKCLSPCKSCLNYTHCSQCQVGFYLTTQNTCTVSCLESFYQEQIYRKCQSCPSQCKTCKSFKICSSCILTHYYYEQSSECIQECPKFYYGNNNDMNGISNNTCLRCQLPCYQCSSKQICLSCFDSFLYDDSCSLICPSGYYANVKTLKCQQCNKSLCLQCKNSPSQCTKCSVQLLLVAQKCQTSCPSGFYFSQQKKECILCEGGCNSCLNISYCLSCMQGFVHIQQEGLCVNECAQGYYKHKEMLTNNITSNSSTTSKYTCLSCPLNCQSCTFNTISNAVVCIQCSQSYYISPLDSQTCLSSCPDGYYKQSTTCMACSLPCDKCSGQQYCIQCSVGYGYSYQGDCVVQCPLGYFVYNKKQCRICSQDCLLCQQQQTTCVACSNELLLLVYFQASPSGNQVVSSCKDECPKGYYSTANKSLQSSNGSSLLSYTSQCQPCSTNCQTCSTQFDNCTGCRYSKCLHQGRCLNECPLQYYKDSLNKTCLRCPFECEYCLNKTFCLKCTEGYHMKEDNLCHQSCQSNQYKLQGLCRPCSYPCLTCLDQSKCLSCLIGVYYLNHCLQQCPQGSYYYQASNNNATEQRLCLACSPNCSKCIDQKQCLFCLSGFLFDGLCRQSCPQGYYPNYGVCLQCMQGCLQCNNSYTCAYCQNGTYIFQEKCVAYCPTGYVQQVRVASNRAQGKCVSCDSECSKCFKLPSKCTQCNKPYFLNIDRCLHSCPDGTYKDQKLYVCQPCVSPCQTCSNAYSCQSCIYSYLLYRQYSRNQCVQGPTCPNSYYLNIQQNVCEFICPDEYYVQSTTRTCSKQCLNQYVTYEQNKSCLQQCPQLMWIDQNRICQNNQTRPLILPYLNCQDLVVRNLLFLRCTVNTPLLNVQDLTISSFKTSQGSVTLLKIKNNTQFYLLILDVQKQLKGQYLTLQLTQKYMLISTQQQKTQTKYPGNQKLFNKVSNTQKAYPLQNYRIKLIIEKYIPYNFQQRQVGINFHQIGQSISYGGLLLWCFSLLKNIKSTALLFIINLQWLFSLSLLSFDGSFPPNLNQFLQSFKFSTLLNFDTESNANQQSIWYLKQLQKEQFWTIDKYYQLKSSLFLVYLLISIFLAIFFITLLVHKLVQFFKKEQEQTQTLDNIGKKCQIINQRFQFNYTYHLILITANAISIAVNLQFVKSDAGSLAQSILFILAYLVFITVSSYIYAQSKDKNPKYSDKKPLRSTAFFFINFVEILLQNTVIIWSNFQFYVGFGMIITILNIVAWSWIYQKSQPGRCSYLQMIQICKILVLIILTVGRIKQEKWSPNDMYMYGFAEISAVFILILLSSISIAKQLFGVDSSYRDKEKDKTLTKITKKQLSIKLLQQQEQSAQTSGFQDEDQSHEQESFFSNKTPISYSDDESQNGDIIDFDESMQGTSSNHESVESNKKKQARKPPRQLYRYNKTGGAL